MACAVLVGLGPMCAAGDGPSSCWAGAVVGVVGALTGNAGVRPALANPELAGVTWGVDITPPPADVTSASVSGRFLSEVARAALGASVAVVRRDLVGVDGVGCRLVFLRYFWGGCGLLATSAGNTQIGLDEK